MNKKAFTPVKYFQRKFSIKDRNFTGFTLIELLIVIGIIAILAAGVIVAINPGRQFAQARDATRESHINTLHSGLLSYQVSNNGNLSGLPLEADPTEICNTNLENPDCEENNLVDLSVLVDEGHINKLPVDPQATGDGTGYEVAEGSIILVAPLAETRFIAVGTTQAELATPTLTSPTATSTGDTTADGSVDTDKDNGTLYWVATTSSTSPSKAQVKSGQDSDGTTASASGNQAVTTTGTQDISASGLTADTTYYFHFTHENDSSDQSQVVSSGSFTTATATFSCASAGQGQHTVDGDVIYCDASSNMWSPSLSGMGDATDGTTATFEWGCYETEIGASSDTDGAANTDTILTNDCMDDSGGENVAAKACNQLAWAGSSQGDWYLPAIDTVEGLYNEEGSTPSYDYNAESDYYWSSTESSSSLAHRLAFDSGGNRIHDKRNSSRVRCVRR